MEYQRNSDVNLTLKLHEICANYQISRFAYYMLYLKQELSVNDQKLCLETCDDNNNNIFHIAAFNVKFPGLITDMMSDETLLGVLTREEIRKMLSDRNKDGDNVLLAYCQRKFNADDDENHEDDFARTFRQLFLFGDFINILPATNRKGVNIFQYLCERPNRSALEWLWHTIYRNIDNDVIVRLVTSRDNEDRTIFHHANTNETFTFLLKLLENDLKVKVTEMFKKQQLGGNRFVYEIRCTKNTLKYNTGTVNVF